MIIQTCASHPSPHFHCKKAIYNRTAIECRLLQDFVISFWRFPTHEKALNTLFSVLTKCLLLFAQTFSPYNWPLLGCSMNYTHLIWLLCENLHGSVQRRSKRGVFLNCEIRCCNMWHRSSKSLLFAFAKHFAGHGTSFKAMFVRKERQYFSACTHTANLHVKERAACVCVL